MDIYRDSFNIDALCSRFDSEWQATSQLPDIESYLSEANEAQRPELFKSLLEVDLEHRRERSLECDTKFYREKFPQYADTIALALSSGKNEETSRLDQSTSPLPEADAGLQETLAVADSEPADRQQSFRGSRFRKLRPFAKGGMGVVFIAYDEEVRREVLLKQIRGKTSGEEAVARFIREGRLTGQLEHPSIVPVYSIGRDDDGNAYYAMRLVQGVTMDEAIDSYYKELSLIQFRQNPAFRKLLQSFMRVCEAVEYAHRQGVIHRDIKPPNIVIGDLGETFLLDWGLAKDLKETEENGGDHKQQDSVSTNEELTVAGAILGTPGYMSPEQARGLVQEVGPRSDIYGLGATLYKLLTGKSPFTGSNVREVIQKVCTGDMRKPRSIQRRVPRTLEAICVRAMSVEPWHRQSSALELASEIEAWLAHEPVPGYREPFLERVLRQLKALKLLTVAAVAFILGILSFVAAIGLGLAAGLLE